MSSSSTTFAEHRRSRPACASSQGARLARALAPCARLALLIVVGVGGAAGCSEVRGRKMLQEANELYKRGRYQEAVGLFERAEKLVPQLPVLWLNKGYTCRQLLTPGSPAPASPESARAAACARAAFTRLQELAPQDPRGEQLYVQTLFDTDDFAALEAMFLAQNRRAPGGIDLDAVTGLQQVYFRWGRWPQALFWSRKAAAARPREAEAQYRVGAFIWQILSSRGGGAEVAAFDPRPRAAGSPPVPPPPVTAASDITGALRVELAEEGVRYLEKALALRPNHQEAMSYVALLHRQRSFAFFGEPARWQAAVDQANQWQKRGLDARAGLTAGAGAVGADGTNGPQAAARAHGI
jgi:tetratricopeptide (TPR) repeat protein